MALEEVLTVALLVQNERMYQSGRLRLHLTPLRSLVGPLSFLHRETDLSFYLGKNQGLPDLGKNQGFYWAQ